ncbi:MAG: anti-sigma factor family protein [Phenylobacterium sp.]|uniref:anti-sigma factor family protein n=1 Tax=Phenylobacterium sp. TaxID=1871053 RepID=UPI003918FA6E
MTDADAVTAFDLEAFVDGQLDAQRRFEVEDYLARNPDAAARVMADLRSREAVRLLAAAPAGPPPSVQLEAVGRLERGLRRADRARKAGRIAALAALVVLGGAVGRLAAPGPLKPDVASEFVAEAVAAHRTARIRAAMGSQPEAVYYNPAEIRSATRIDLPRLPDAWQVTDVQVFPSDDGPTVVIALAAQELGAISLFAAPAPEFAETHPRTVEAEGRAVSYWQVGRQAYALTGRSDPSALEAAAARLSRAMRERPAEDRIIAIRVQETAHP